MKIRNTVTSLQKRFNIDLRYIIEGNFWLLAARIVAIGTGMVLTVLFANRLTPAAFGFYKYVISLAGILGAFSLTGIGMALINSVARGDEGTIRTTFMCTFYWGLLPSFLAVSGSAYYFYNHNLPLAYSLLAIALISPLSGSFGNYRQLFTGRGDFKTGTIIGIVRSIVPVIIMVAVLFMTKDPLILVVSYFVSNIIVVIGMYLYVVWKYKVPKTAEGTESTLRFARYTSVLGFFTQVTSQVDQFLIWHFVGPAGVAFYSFSTSSVEQLQSVSGNVFSLIAPKLATKSEGELHRILPVRIKQMFFVMIPFTLLYIVFAPVLYHYLFPAYTSVVWLSQIYALTLLLQPLGFVDAALIAKEDTGSRNILVASGQAIKLILLVVGIYFYGVVGGVVALILSELANTVLAFIVLRQMRPAQHTP